MQYTVYDGTSSVERAELNKSGRALRYPPTEKIDIIEVNNFPLLGKLTAFRFIEWVTKNPGGVISLPTGKTPEHFIKWVSRILERWDTKEIQLILADYGIDGSKRPDMKSLSFVQIDEFYPMDSGQHNSFNYYVRKYYIDGFGLSPEKAVLIDSTRLGVPDGKSMQEIFPDGVVDLSLRVRQTRTELESLQRDTINRVDWFCMEYEHKIRDLGGIGFFLGGIGPDGHIAFNVRGSSFYSVTRLTGTNYETQAAAATDLGGIEISRSRLVITIGLATITANDSATAIIIAAGDAKAAIVREAVEERKNPKNPASALQDLRYARFYLTKGASSLLEERRFIDFCALPSFDNFHRDNAIISLAIRKKKMLRELTDEECRADKFANELLTRLKRNCKEVAAEVQQSLESKIAKGLEPLSKTVFLHTEPHHDDITLGYLSYLYHLVRDPTNEHYFANMTSGFTAVSNHYYHSVIRKLKQRIESPSFAELLHAGYFKPSNQTKREEEVYMFLDGVAAKAEEAKDEAEVRRVLRNLVEVYSTDDITILKEKIAGLDRYFRQQYPGAKDPSDVQLLKGMLREWEVELLWAYFGTKPSSIFPLRLGFYQGDIFSEEPQVDRDVVPILGLIRKLKPNVITVAFDPEGSGPDTHYKVLQATAEAIRLYEKESGDSKLKIWGYRNIWYRFMPAEADIMIPVSLNTLSLLHTSFMNCFGSQSAASFPSYEYDGPFSELAQKIQVQQYGMIRTCLGKEFFQQNVHPRLRGARGMIFLKEMSLPQFYEKVRQLRKMTEAKQ
ncbi:MAG TPA: glucosamine-6-phosphate deaminase [Bacteroidota bacterium]|nr:glucosamine-6-phosphate deaminase [Bacteroidota bacterium]